MQLVGWSVSSRGRLHDHLVFLIWSVIFIPLQANLRDTMPLAAGWSVAKGVCHKPFSVFETDGKENCCRKCFSFGTVKTSYLMALPMCIHY